MPRCALIVEFALKPGARAAFDAVMTDHAKRTLAEEAGCQQFDILHADDDENRIVLIEVYEDLAAYELHRQGPRMAGVNAALEPLTASRKRIIGSLI